MKWQNKIEIEENMKEKKLLITIHEVAWKKKTKTLHVLYRELNA